MADGQKSFVLYSDRLKSTLVDSEREIRRLSSSFGGTPKDTVEFAPSPFGYNGPFKLVWGKYGKQASGGGGDDSSSGSQSSSGSDSSSSNSSSSALSGCGVLYYCNGRFTLLPIGSCDESSSGSSSSSGSGSSSSGSSSSSSSSGSDSSSGGSDGKIGAGAYISIIDGHDATQYICGDFEDMYASIALSIGATHIDISGLSVDTTYWVFLVVDMETRKYHFTTQGTSSYPVVPYDDAKIMVRIGAFRVGGDTFIQQLQYGDIVINSLSRFDMAAEIRKALNIR